MNQGYYVGIDQPKDPATLDRVFMSDRNGALVVGKPFYIKHDLKQDYTVGQNHSYIVQATSETMVGYCLFHEDELIYVLTTEQIKALPLTDLGEL